jgi:transcriptional regulator with XRE-family HTH domain
VLNVSELGKRLKEAREEKGLTLDDLEERTKIQKRYLAGIEQGNYRMIPGKFYVRAFIKQYAEAVGLNPEEIFEQYRNEIPSVHEDQLPEQLSRTRSRRVLNDRGSKWMDMLPKILAAVFVVAFAVFIWFIWQNYMTGNPPGNGKQTTGNFNMEESGNLPEDQPSKESENGSGGTEKSGSTQEEGGNTGGEEGEEGQSETQSVKAVQTSGNSTVYELTGADRFLFKIQASAGGETWVSVRNGAGAVLFEGLLKDGAAKEFDLTDDSAVKLVIGRAYQTEMYVNGEKVDFALAPDETITQNIEIRYVKNEQ